MNIHKPEITRAAILIGCPGRGKSYLPGVQSDLENMRIFLRSPRSGCFYDNEIYTLENATFDEVQEMLLSINVDYCQIYFSGHGFTNGYTKQRMVCLNDHDVPDTLFKTKSRIELVLVDACRNEIPSISGITEYVEPYSSFTGSLARQAFDDYIRNAQSGRLVVYGTQPNTVSLDMRNGGVFTYSLLTVASTIHINGAEFSYVMLKDILPHVENYIKDKNREAQIPDIVSQTVGYNMPFIINAQQIKVEQIQVQQRRNRAIKKENNPVGGLIVTGLLAWGLISLFKSS